MTKDERRCQPKRKGVNHPGLVMKQLMLTILTLCNCCLWRFIMIFVCSTMHVNATYGGSCSMSAAWRWCSWGNGCEYADRDYYDPCSFMDTSHGHQDSLWFILMARACGTAHGGSLWCRFSARMWMLAMKVNSHLFCRKKRRKKKIDVHGA